MKIAYIDDCIDNLEYMELALGSDFEIDTYQDVNKFLSQDFRQYSAIILDVHMPNKDGFELYHDILSSEVYPGCPVFFISSDETDEVVVQSFELGAVDFIPRRTGPTELLARINSRIDYHKKNKPILEFGDLKLNLSQLVVTLKDEILRLTFTEVKLVNSLLRAYPEICTRDELIKNVWGKDYAQSATVHTHISNLNSKLKDWDHEIIIERNVGVSLQKKSDF